jgi:signal transduction histidine kinase
MTARRTGTVRLRHRFFWRLYRGYVTLIVATTGAVGIMIAHSLEGEYLAETSASLRGKAVLLRELVTPAVEANDKRLTSRLQKLGAELSTRFTVLDAHGSVLADSHEAARRMDDHSHRPEILDAQLKGFGTATRYSLTLKSRMMYVALPYQLRGKHAGFIRASLPLLQLDTYLDHLRWTTALVGLAALAVALGVGWLFARQVTGPLNSMTDAALALAAGETSRAVPVASADELGSLAIAFNSMARELSDRMSRILRLEHVRRDFIANVSHELKTPLTAITGLVDTLIEDEAMEAVKHRSFLERVRQQVIRLSTLVADLLTLARIEAQEASFRVSPVDLREPAEDLGHTLLAVASEKGVTLEVKVPSDPLVVSGDEEALRQIIGNLLDNAIKYTPAGGKVTLTIRLQGDRAEIEVADSGIGIEGVHQARIFERFYRVDTARSRELGGTGLGLAIVKHSVMALKGDISVESTPAVGSTFRVVLPLAASS